MSRWTAGLGEGRDGQCELRPGTFREWLRCGMCWEVKGGIILLLLSKGLMLWGNPPVTGLRWRVGWVVFWVAVGCLVFGLLRDAWLIATTKFERSRSTPKKG